MNRLLRLALAAFPFAAVPAFAGTIVFSSGDFSGWSIGAAFPGSYTAQNASVQATGGNSDSYLLVQTTTNDITHTAYFNPLFTFDPSPGATITGLDLDVDVRTFAGTIHSYAIAVQQGGQTYVSGGTTPISYGSWTRVNFSAFLDPLYWYGVNATPPHQNYRLDSIGGPDFGPGGAPITFGFYTGNWGGLGITVGYDNFSLTVTTSTPVVEPPPPPPPAPVPDSATTGLALLGAYAGLVALRSRRARR